MLVTFDDIEWPWKVGCEGARSSFLADLCLYARTVWRTGLSHLIRHERGVFTGVTMFPTQEGPYLRLQRSDVERPNLAWHPWKSHILQSTIPCNLWEWALAPPPEIFRNLHGTTEQPYFARWPNWMKRNFLQERACQTGMLQVTPVAYAHIV